MRDIWDGLPIWGQDLAILLALLLPLAVIAGVLLRGFAPWPLTFGMIRRFGWINAVFVALIAVSVGMGIGVVAQERGLREGTAQAASKFDLVVSAPGSEITMLLASVYLRPGDVPLVDGETFARIAADDRVRLAAPIAFGDSFRGDPVVGTVADFVTHLSDDRIDGRLFEAEGEAVVGALIDLDIGAEIEPVHGDGSFTDPHAHKDLHYTVVGRMAPTSSPWDRAVLVPIESVWDAHGLDPGHDDPHDDETPEDHDDHDHDADHDEHAGHADHADEGDLADHADADDHDTHAHADDHDDHAHADDHDADHPELGPPFDPDRFPGTPAVIVVPRVTALSYALQSDFTRDAQTMAFLPGAVLSQLYAILGDIRQAMSLMSLVAQILVAASVLTGLVMLMRLFERHMGLLRAVGAPTRFLIALVWSYGAALLAIGGVLGLVLGWAVATLLSGLVAERTGIAIPVGLGWSEVHLVAAFVSATACVALIPVWALIRGTRAARVRA